MNLPDKFYEDFSELGVKNAIDDHVGRGVDNQKQSAVYIWMWRSLCRRSD